MLAGTRCRPPAALWTLFALDLFDSVFNPSHSDTDCVAPKNWEIHSSLVISVSNALLRLPYFTPLGYLQLEVGDDRDLPENIATSEIYVQPESPLEIPYSILYGHQEHLIGDQVDYENILMSQRLIYLASAVSGLWTTMCRDVSVKESKQGAKEEKVKMIPLSLHVLRQLKMDLKSTKAITAIISGVNFVQGFVRRKHSILCTDIFPEVTLDSEDYSIADLREELGMFIRDIKNFWQSSVILACACEIVNSFDKDEFDSFSSQSVDPPVLRIMREQDHFNSYVKRIDESEQLEVTVSARIILTYTNFMKLVRLLSLNTAWTIRPLFNSKTIGEQLGLKPGPQIGIIIDQAIRWQLRNPHGTYEELMTCLEES